MLPQQAAGTHADPSLLNIAGAQHTLHRSIDELFHVGLNHTRLSPMSSREALKHIN